MLPPAYPKRAGRAIRRCLLIGSIFVGCSADGPGPVQTAVHESDSTWDIIQTEIFAGQCVSCHTAGTSFGRQSGLVLTPDVAYEQLVSAAPTNAAAAADGMMRVSDLGQGMPGLLKSYLWEKINAPDQQHFYGDHPYYGEIMPFGGNPLTNGELAFIRAWIEAGAPETGHVADPDILKDKSRYEEPEFKPLAEPENGVQLHLPPFEIQPNSEREIFVVHPLNNEDDIFLERVQISMKSGSHHFLLYTFQDDIPPERMPEPYEYRELHNSAGQYVLATILTQFYHLPIAGSQWPFIDVSLPPGVAIRLPKNTLLDLNSHYVNRTSQPATGEVYTNLHFADPSEVEHEARFFSLNNLDISLPAGEVTTLEKDFTFSKRTHIVQLLSHAHQLMVEFRVEMIGGAHDGELIYAAYDWDHPPILRFDSPLVLEPGEGFRLEATYDNTTDQEINFGFLSTDEMMILFGISYRD